MDITLVYNKSNTWGIKKDAELLSDALKAHAGRKLRHADPLEPPVKSDVAIHLEIPAYGWMPFAAYNIVIVNPEWWEAAWNAYLPRIDMLVFKSECARQLFLEKIPELDSSKTTVLPWAAATTLGGAPPPAGANSACWFLGGSTNKIAAANVILPLWKESWPPLHVYVNRTLDIDPSKLSANVTLYQGRILDENEKRAISLAHDIHLAFSIAEGFGHVVAEAEALGRRIIGNRLPVYKEVFADSILFAGTDDTYKDGLTWKSSLRDKKRIVADIEEALALPATRTNQFLRAKTRSADFKKNIGALFSQIKDIRNKTKHYPPVLMPEDCPKISIVTLLYGRRKFFEMACHNLLATDYPQDKIEWIIVEDTTDPAEQCTDKIVQFTQGCSARGIGIQIVYVPLDKRCSIGKKRNLGCERATGDFILMMDDDDHYPPTAFRRRVAWLLRGPWTGTAKCAVATTIACYDLRTGVSSVNTPPLTLGLAGRCSEATLTFTKAFWERQKFPEGEGLLGEGEAFLAGRESEVVELPPQQIIVAFSHSKNASGRRVPVGDKAGCFWGFPREYLEFIHGLEGVKVEAA